MSRFKCLLDVDDEVADEDEVEVMDEIDRFKGKVTSEILVYRKNSNGNNSKTWSKGILKVASTLDEPKSLEVMVKESVGGFRNKFWNHHNVVFLHQDVLEKQLVVYERVECLYDYISEQPELFFTKGSANQLKMFIRDMVEGHSLVQSMNRAFKMFDFNSVYFVDHLNIGTATFKLNLLDTIPDGGKRHAPGNWKQLGRMLRGLTKDQVEVEDLCFTLEHKPINLNSIKKKILNHIFFWTDKRVEFLVHFVAILKKHPRRDDIKKRIRERGENIVRSFPWTKGLEDLKTCMVINSSSKFDEFDPVDYLFFMRNSLQHFNNVTTTVKKQLKAQTRSTLMHRFTYLQPRMLLTLRDIIEEMNLEGFERFFD